MTDKAVRVRISGRVQGVFFRAWTRDNATRLGLAGWVRNRADGTVEAVFAGPEADVDRMVNACWQGPDYAWVDAVVVEAAEMPKEAGFRQLPSV
jgi:acylphosphatase